MMPPACVMSTKVKLIKVSEPRSTSATFKNEGQVEHLVTQFDGCVIKNKTSCDWIVEKCGIGRVAVELKGCDVKHAVLQIGAAITYLRANGMGDLTIGALVICSRSPSNDSTLQKLKDGLARQYGVPLHVKKDGRNIEFEKILSYKR